MGEKSQPLDLYLTDPSTGQPVKIPDTLVEITFAGDDPDEQKPFLHNLSKCYFCDHSDSKRQKDGCIRCKRWSQWVPPDGEVCDEYTGFSMTLPLDDGALKKLSAVIEN